MTKPTGLSRHGRARALYIAKEGFKRANRTGNYNSTIGSSVYCMDRDEWVMHVALDVGAASPRVNVSFPIRKSWEV